MDSLWWPAHAVAAVGWAALIFGPSAASFPVNLARLAAVGLSVFYVGLLCVNLPDAGVLASDYSPAGVTTFFGDPGLRLLGWAHYLAFDLLIGSWEVEEARRHAISRLALRLCLLLTLMVGPVGLLAFLLCLRLARGRGLPPENERDP